MWTEYYSYFENLSGKVFPPSFNWRRFPQPATIFKFLPTDAMRQNAIKTRALLTTDTSLRRTLQNQQASTSCVRRSSWTHAESRAAAAPHRPHGVSLAAIIQLLLISGQTELAFLAWSHGRCWLRPPALPPVRGLGLGYGEAKASDVLFMRSCQILQVNGGDVDGGQQALLRPRGQEVETHRRAGQQAEAEPLGYTGANVLEKCGWGAWL